MALVTTDQLVRTRTPKVCIYEKFLLKNNILYVHRKYLFYNYIAKLILYILGVTMLISKRCFTLACVKNIFQLVYSELQ